ncbi:uncharacterized protein LOC105426737 [Pogonomyrmex barbatus]|uniref:Uncharacterized protein LOC105426737 n=1 Tax=Pogonomyrmex barbatus TaxID=144034 RepID=A0A8N1S7H9_9HYME|nr:uncharacterized protein LOC105426737 [Pogonomyrmex barbatus]
MICIKTRYFNIHRILLLAVGLWPYCKSNLVQFQIMLCFTILISFIIFQLTIFLTAECTSLLVIKVLCTTTFSIIYVIKYNSFWINARNLTIFFTTECTSLLIIKVLCTTTFSILYVIKYNSFLINARNVKCLMERLQQICNELKNEDEINIMKEHGNNTKRYTTVITLFCICCVFILIIMPILKPLLNIILHINKSESHKTLRFIINQEYFIDQEKYSFLILLHINTFICIGSITVTATGTMLLGYMVHGCGMFKIASYRMEQAMTIKIMIHKEIIYAVDIHRKAIKYVELLLSNFEGSFVLLILVGVISLSLNLFATYQIHVITEYFIDQEKYSYLILLHVNIVVCIGAATVTATGTMLRGCLIHACGMFKIASYRIEQAMTMKFKKFSTNNEIMIYKEIGCAIDIHRKAMKYSEFLLSSFEGSFASLILVGVISLSLNLFSVFQTASLGNNEECVMHIVILFVILLYMFLANYVGQEVTDHNNYVYSTAYNVRWYIAPIHIQKLILFILQKGSKVFVLNVGKLFGASLESFATLIKASMSYFTFMCSMQ